MSKVYSRISIRHSRQTPHLRNLSGTPGEYIIPLHSITRIIAIEIGNDGFSDIDECILLDQDLGGHARVDARCRDIFVARAVDMYGAEADRRSTRIDVGPVVVVVCDV